MADNEKLLHSVKYDRCHLRTVYFMISSINLLSNVIIAEQLCACSNRVKIADIEPRDAECD